MASPRITRKDSSRPQRAALALRLEREPLTVSLRRNAVKAFVIAKSKHVVIGVVRWGQEYGLLTISPAGDYLRVNGSYEERLDTDEVRAAIVKVFLTGELPPGRSRGDGPPAWDLEFLDEALRQTPR